MEEKRSVREETRRLKRIIVVVLCCMAAFIVLYLVLSNVIAANKKDDGEDNFVGRKYTIIYHDTVADNDVMKDPDYLGLNRGIWYYNTPADGEGIALEDRTKGDYGQPVELLYDYLHTVIAGDAETYNTYFSDYYFAKDGNEPKKHFYQQELYGNGGIRIREMQRAVQKTDENGKIYTQYDYTVTFMIHKNNGTFMLIDSDAEVTLYYVISDISGEYKIDNVLKYRQ